MAATAGTAPRAPDTERTQPDVEPPPTVVEEARTVLRIGTATRPDSLNPLVASNRLGRILSSLLYDELLPFDVSQEPLPGLVSEWSPSADGSIWLLELRQGLRWSDGAAVTARDVVHTLRRIQRDPRSRFSRWLDDVTLVKQFNQRRVGIRLATPRTTPPVLPIPLLPRHIWSSVRPREVVRFANDPPIGSGPFASTTPGDANTLTLTATENHWRGETAVDELTLHFYETQTELADALEAGLIDVADDLDPQQLARLEQDPAIDVRPTPATAFVSLGMNTGSTEGDGNIVLREARVRRAIAHALDREELRELAIGPYGLAGSTIVPPATGQHAQPTPEQELAFDPERAGVLLTRAGLKDRDGDGVRENSLGLPLELRLFTRRSLPETERLGSRVAEALAAVGVGVSISELTDRELTQRIRAGRFDLFIWGWDVGSDPSFIASVLSCGEALPTGLSDTYFCDGTYDELYTSYLAETSNAERESLIAGMQARAYARAPYVVLYYRPTFQAFRTDRFEASADDSVPIVFALPPERPINLELRDAAPAQPALEGAEERTEAVAPTTGLIEEIRSSLLWRILAIAGLVVLGLLLLPLVVRTLLLLVRRARRNRDAERAEEIELPPAAEASDDTEPGNDEGRPEPPLEDTQA